MRIGGGPPRNLTNRRPEAPRGPAPSVTNVPRKESFSGESLAKYRSNLPLRLRLPQVLSRETHESKPPPVKLRLGDPAICPPPSERRQAFLAGSPRLAPAAPGRCGNGSRSITLGRTCRCDRRTFYRLQRDRGAFARDGLPTTRKPRRNDAELNEDQVGPRASVVGPTSGGFVFASPAAIIVVGRSTEKRSESGDLILVQFGVIPGGFRVVGKRLVRRLHDRAASGRRFFGRSGRFFRA